MGCWRSIRTSPIRMKAKSSINIPSWPPTITWWNLFAAHWCRCWMARPSRNSLPRLLEAELRVVEEEHHAPIVALSKTADAMPGFGIVAAVLGIVVTMGAIDGPAEEIGEKVGAALVGTFLGILLSYGFLAPLCGRMEFYGQSGTRFFQDDCLHHSGVFQRFAAEGGHRTRPPRRGQRIAPEPRRIGSTV